MVLARCRRTKIWSICPLNVELHQLNTDLLGVRSESAVRPIGTERCRTGRAFGKSCRIDLTVLGISVRLLPVIMEFQAAAYLSRDPQFRLASSAAFVCLLQSRTVSVRRPIKMTNRTNAFPNAMGAIRPNSAHVPTIYRTHFCAVWPIGSNRSSFPNTPWLSDNF
jgi:hypothetical protein